MAPSPRAGWQDTLPFWSPFLVLPLAVPGPLWGGLAVFLLPVCLWQLTPLLDRAVGRDGRALPPDTPETELAWHRAGLRLWPAVQTAILFGTIAWLPTAGHLGGAETAMIAVGLGAATGAIGIVHAHELMHRPGRLDRWLGDLLMTQVLYGHFRSEHLLVHHLHVGTPADPVTARRGEGFHRFFLRVLPGGLASAWAAERARLARAGRPVWHRSNPFWRYAGLSALWLALAAVLGGWTGLAVFLGQAVVAVWQLELINYIEHYGLTRKHLGGGRYEPALPRHSWNDSHSVSRALLINLPRHSDHHASPGRAYPLLQTYPADTAPILPFGYGVMTLLALVPPLWRRVMDPRVRRWRAMFYPEIADWTAYDRGTTPRPR